jgi:MATE family multidrug resistance protein
MFRFLFFASGPAFRAEVRSNLALAAPLITAQIAAVGMGAVDTVYAGRVGPHALAAVAVSVNLYNLFLIFFLGLMMACSPIVAQMFGAQRPPAEIAAFMRGSRRFALVAGAGWTLGLDLIAPAVLRALNLPDETTQLAIGFIRYLSMAGLMTSLWFALRFGAEGLGQVRPIVIAGLCGLAGNALFGWVFVFGHLGLPALGVRGLGLATTCATALMAAVLALQYRFTSGLRAIYVAGDAAPGHVSAAPQILRLGLPIALIVTAEGALFVLTALLMSRFGEAVVAAYQVAINFASLMFMIPLGVGLATTVRVGHAMGAGDLPLARHRGLTGLCLGGLNAASNAAIMLLFSGVIVSLYTRDPLIAAQAVSFLWLAAAFQLFDGVQATANGALRGIKDTRLPMLITLFSYWGIGMPVAAGLAFWAGFGPAGLWWGLTAGLCAAAIGLSWRFAVKTHAGRTHRSIHTSIGSELDA